MHDDFKFGLVVAPDAVIVGGLYTEGVSARRQVGIGGTILVAHIVPITVETFEHIGILNLLGRTIAERCKRQGDHL